MFEAIIVLLIYFAVVYLIGFIATKRTHNVSDYILGGRSLNAYVTAMGAGASDMSGWLLMGLPGAVYLSGLNQIWMPIGLIIGAYLNWQFVAKPLRIQTEKYHNALTIPEYLDNRFADNSGVIRLVTSLSILVFFTIYAAAGLVGGALLFNMIFHIGYHNALYLSTAVIMIYTSIGGFLAVNWVDFFQGSLMFLALIIAPAVAIYHLDGWHMAMTTIAQLQPHSLNAFDHMNVMLIVSLLAWGLGYFGQPHILVRFMAARRPDDIPIARRVCMSWMIVSLAGAVLTGLVGIGLYHQPPLQHSETVFLQIAYHFFNPWITAILLSAVLSAIMSTIAAQLLASSSAITEDIYRKFLRQKASDKNLLWFSRLSVAVIALLAMWFASNPDSNILIIVSYAWAGLGAAFGPVIISSLYWSKTSKAGAIFGIIVGGTTVIIWKSLQGTAAIFDWYEIIPGFILSWLAIVVGSWLWPNHLSQR